VTKRRKKSFLSVRRPFRGKQQQQLLEVALPSSLADTKETEAMIEAGTEAMTGTEAMIETAPMIETEPMTETEPTTAVEDVAGDSRSNHAVVAHDVDRRHRLLSRIGRRQLAPAPCCRGAGTRPSTGATGWLRDGPSNSSRSRQPEKPAKNKCTKKGNEKISAEAVNCKP
jgi:hypothetical protein